MNRDEAKQLLPIIKAFSEWKEIERRSFGEKQWKEANYIVHTDCNEYRIKPSPKYRSFANAEECMTEILKHQPFLKYKCGSICRDVYLSIVKIKLDGIETDKGRYEFNDAMGRFTFADGSVFGVKEESDD